VARSSKRVGTSSFVPQPGRKTGRCCPVPTFLPPGRRSGAAHLRTALENVAQGIYREAQEAVQHAVQHLDVPLNHERRGREVVTPFVTLQTGEHPMTRSSTAAP